MASSKDKLAQLVAGTDTALAELNREYAIVVAGGRPAVLVERNGGVDLWTREALNAVLADREILVGKRHEKLAKVWWEHEETRRYKGIDFDPDGTPPGVYNMWRGFSVEPAPGSCARFLDHIHNIVAAADDDLFAWVMAWLANIIQRPGEKSGTALALRGEPGSGKTIVGEILGSLFRPHYLLVDHPHLVTGRFNSHVSNLLLLHADEAFFAGDRAAAGRLRSLITAPRLALEFKGREPITVKSCVRLLVTSEHDWVVPASLGERRFAVLDVSPARIGDLDYFNAIVDEMNAGGREALLQHLMDFDLASVELRKIPQTAALLDQKEATMEGPESFWLNRLRRGAVYSISSDWEDKVLCDRVYEDYIKYSIDCGVRYRATPEMFGKALRTMCPAIERRRLREGGDRNYYYILPPLNAARAAMAEHMQAAIVWDQP